MLLGRKRNQFSVSYLFKFAAAFALWTLCIPSHTDMEEDYSGFLCQENESGLSSDLS